MFDNKLIDKLTVNALLARLPFEHRAVIRFYLQGWQRKELGITRYRFRRIIKELRTIAGIKKKCARCETWKSLAEYYRGVNCKACCIAMGDIHICAACGSETTVSITRRKNNQSGKFFCSRTCTATHNDKWSSEYADDFGANPGRKKK